MGENSNETTCSKLNIYNGLDSSVCHLSNSYGSKNLSVLAQNYVNIFWIITIIRITLPYLDESIWRHYI